jgi:peptide/nickel transport system substrate-binding protein
VANYWNQFTNQRVSRRRVLAATGGLSVSAAILAACGGGSSDVPSGQKTGQGQQAESGPAQKGGTMGFIYTDSPHLNILTNALEYAGYSGQYVYDHLISSRSNENAPFVLEAAEGLEQPDPLTITFKLRPGMTYHNIAPVNGRAVKAEDVVKVQEYVKTLAGAENAFQKDILDKATAPDDRTVVYKLKAPTAYLFTSRLLGHPGPQAIIPPETFDNLSTARQVGSGPFQLDTWTLSTKYHYTRFDKYHGRGKPGLPYRDFTDVFVLQEETAREAAFRSEQVHYWTNASAGSFDQIAKGLSNLANVVEFTALTPFTWNFGMQRGRGPWANPSDIRFRKAMYRTVNRKQFIDLIYQGKAVEPTGILAAGQVKDYLLDAKESAEFFKNDPAEAKQLISATGFDTNKEIVITYLQGGNLNQQSAEILKQQMAQVGLKTRIEIGNAGEFLPRSNRGEYDIFTGTHPGYDSPQAPMRQNHSDSRLAFGGTALGEPDIDRMIEKAEQTPDFKENVKLIKQLQLELLKRYTPYYNILTPTARHLLNKKVQGMEIEAANTSMHEAQAWLKKE